MPRSLFLFATLAAALLPAAVARAQPQQPRATWEEFNQAVMRLCPEQGLQAATPGDLNGLQEDFFQILGPAQLQHLDVAIPRVNGGPKACADRDGIACPTAWNMVALKRSDLMARFTQFACAHAKTIR